MAAFPAAGEEEAGLDEAAARDDEEEEDEDHAMAGDHAMDEDDEEYDETEGGSFGLPRLAGSASDYQRRWAHLMGNDQIIILL